MCTAKSRMMLAHHFAFGGVLKLGGTTSYIDFDGVGPNGAAHLQASCTNEVASISWAHPTEFALPAGTGTFFDKSTAAESLRSNNVTIQFRSVPPTCVNAPADQPCAPDDPREKPLVRPGAQPHISLAPTHSYALHMSFCLLAVLVCLHWAGRGSCCWTAVPRHIPCRKAWPEDGSWSPVVVSTPPA